MASMRTRTGSATTACSNSRPARSCARAGAASRDVCAGCAALKQAVVGKLSQDPFFFVEGSRSAVECGRCSPYTRFRFQRPVSNQAVTSVPCATVAIAIATRCLRRRLPERANT